MQLAGVREEMLGVVDKLRTKLSASRSAAVRDRIIARARREILRIQKRTKHQIDDRVTRRTLGSSRWYPQVRVNQARLSLEKILEEITSEAVREIKSIATAGG